MFTTTRTLEYLLNIAKIVKKLGRLILIRYSEYQREENLERYEGN